MNEHDTSIPSGSTSSDADAYDPHPSEMDQATVVEAPPEEEGENTLPLVEEPDNPIDRSLDSHLEEVLSVAESTDRNPDPLASAKPSAPAPSPNVEELQQEIHRLQAQLTKASADAIQREIATGEFRELYPNVRFEDLPDDVFTDVQHGIPLCAAYALSERRRLQKEAHAARINAQNRARSSGALGNAETDLFSPDEVRAMSHAEVRTNYDKILRSMQTWH